MRASAASENLEGMEKPAPVDYDVHDLIRQRYSARGFSGAPVGDAALRSIFEAARWSASSYNDQPWRFIVARPDEPGEFERMLDCLISFNRSWAQRAGALILSLVVPNFAHNGKLNAHALHDVGLAVGQMTFQASALGLAVRQMAGFHPDKVRATYALPESVEPVSVIALGYPMTEDELPDSLRARELAPREARRPQEEFVFRGGWGRPW